MADKRRWQQAFLLLVIITYCTAQPLESTGSVSDHEATTTPCEEELKTQTTTANENLKDNSQTDGNSLYQSEAGHSHQDDDSTTLCPDELKRQNHESLSGKNGAILNDLEYKLSGTNQLEDKPNSTEEETGKNELNHLNNSDANKTEEKYISLPHSHAESGTELGNVQEDTKNQNIIDDYPKKSVNGLSKLDEEYVSTIHTGTENRFEDKSDTIVEDQSTNAHQFATDSQYDTTVCPEELLKQRVPQNDLKANEKTEVQLVSHNSESLEVLTQDLLQSEDKRFQNQLDANGNNANDQSSENTDETTTICPEELTKHEQETGGNDISVKTLLNVQKDSVLLKLVKKKFEAENSKLGDAVRRKRETQNYSPYYSNHPSYNSQGVALSTNDGSAQELDYNTRVSSQHNYFQQPAAATYNNVRTYQQIQRQYQNPYPKAYQNYVKPIKSYQNPSSYVRYPSNGNFNNLYKLKNGGNRRQYQASVRPKTTTIRSTRATSKKKFRPSPVFA